jgi:DNA-binding beta-propeller fold protein YncE
MFTLVALMLTQANSKATNVPYFEVPAGSQYAQVNPGGTTILPNGRFLTPWGKRLYTGPDLWQVVISPTNGAIMGIHDNGFTVYEGSKFKTFIRKDIAPAAAFTPDGKYCLLSLGDAGSIEVLSASSWESIKTIQVKDGNLNSDVYVNDIAISSDGKLAYVVDIAHQKVVTIDIEKGEVLSRVAAGRQPYALSLSKDGKQLFVANIGIFDYTVISSNDPKADKRGLTKPPFGFPSKESLNGVRTENYDVPGVGDPRVPEAQSVFAYSLKSPQNPTLVKSAKAGILIHAPADAGKSVGGSAPNELLQHGNFLYVSNANNDTVQEFDSNSLKLKRTFKLIASPEAKSLRGVIPSGMALNEKENRLYVCESGLNSVASINLKTGEFVGRIPTGWFPMQLSLSKDGRTLAIATQKGLGRGPKGRFQPRSEADERNGFSEMPGMIESGLVPTDTEFKKGIQTVAKNNGFLLAKPRPQNPIPSVHFQKSKDIEYVVFITKENHTFDGIFGELKSRGAKSEPEYAEFGRNGWIREKGKEVRTPIMPNHLQIADRFAISDNFYMEPQASGDGHRWLVGVYPSLWTTRVFYSGWRHQFNNNAKGRLVSFGSDGSQIPEDYLENGSIWEHLNRSGVNFRNYGEGYELPATDEGWMTNRAGTFYRTNYPMPKILFENTCFNYPAYNNNIPDIARADWFIEDIQKSFDAKGKPLPKFLNIAICNDHGAGARPDRGYPYTCSYMADNDLALGRIVEYLSHRPEWKKMAIFVTQDDSGGDDDMVDRHRSYVLAISPFAKKNYISHEHTSIMSIIKTIYMIFGAGPNNQFDAVANPLHDMFTSKPDYTPYRHLPANPLVFKPEATFDPFDPKFERRRREMSSVRMDDPEYIKKIGGG